MEKQEHIRELFNRYLSGSYSRADLEQLLEYFNIEEDRETLTGLIADAMQAFPVDQENQLAIKKIGVNLENKIFKVTRPVSMVKKLMPWISIAAALLIVSVAVLYFYSVQQNKTNLSAQSQIEIGPGSKNAILILSDGKKLNLQKEQGEISEQSGVIISRSASSELVYSTSKQSIPYNAFNTIETPKGGEYQVVLPDGTKVWLNAASSLKYPISFGALKERKVELSGEAYFEVAHDKSKPFRVKTTKQMVEVLGTHFNINSYANEPNVITTLEQGRVKVSSGGLNLIIAPGESTVLSSVGNMEVQKADLESMLAWKNGRIYFKKTDLKSIMRQVARWYDIEVEYEGPVKNRLFTGGVSRSSNLSVLLKILELNGIHFRLEQNPGQNKLVITQ